MKKDTTASKDQEQASKGGKFGTIFGTILCIIMIPILIANVTMIIKGAVNPEKYPTFFGYAPLIVLTDSMFPEIQSGDLIVIKTTDVDQLQEGDVISFFDPDSTNRTVVTHRIVQVVYGDPQTFITKGDANNAEDTPLPAENVIGRYQFLIHGAGKVAMFLQTLPGFAVCVAVPLILLVVYELLRSRKTRKAKEEDTQALLAELEALRARQAEADAKAAGETPEAPEASESDP